MRSVRSGDRNQRAAVVDRGARPARVGFRSLRFLPSAMSLKRLHAKLRSGRARPSPKKSREPRLSRLRKPDQLSAAEWQARLRRQFGREQSFVLAKLGPEPVFADYVVSNPATRG